MRFALVNHDSILVRIVHDGHPTNGAFERFEDKFHTIGPKFIHVTVEIIDLEGGGDSRRSRRPFVSTARDESEARGSDVVFNPFVFSPVARFSEAKDVFIEGSGTFHIRNGVPGKCDFDDLHKMVTYWLLLMMRAAAASAFLVS